MPEEFSRTTARKRITIGTNYVDVPVITKISFIDASDRYQETQYTIDNSGLAKRETHADEVGGRLFVERIDKWTVLDASDRHQETQISMDNVTGADSVPPHFSTHLKTHVVRYKSPSDPDTWIDSELIDQFVILDPNDRYQETIVTLNQPQNDDDAQANPDDPEISDSLNGVDPPWRTDPFQNIIGIGTGSTGIVEQIFVFRRYGDTCVLANTAAANNAGGGDWYPVTHEFWYEKVAAGETYPPGDTLNPTANPTAAGISSIIKMTSIATRTKLSDLITACVTLSHQAGQLPSSQDGAFGWNPWIVWLNLTNQPQMSCMNPPAGVDIAQPNPSNATKMIEQPPPGSGNFKPQAIYYGVVGYANEDDVGTGGPDIPTGIPPWAVPPS